MAFATVGLALVSLILLLVVANRGERTTRGSRAGEGVDPAPQRVEPAMSEDSERGRAADGPIPPASVVAVVVRDLADGAVVPGISFRFRTTVTATSVGTDRREAEFVTDEGGELRLPADALAKLLVEPVSEEWIMPDYKAGEIERTRSIWMYRRIRVLGTVRGVGGKTPLDPTTVSLVAVGAGLEGYGRPDHQTPDPWNPQWLISHGIQRHEGLAKPGRSGAFEVAVPGIQGVVLRATAPGWRMTWARIPIESERGEASLDLTLFTSYSVSGVIRDENGDPIKRLRVVAYVTQFSSYDGINYEQLSLGGHEGYTAWWNQKDNSAAVNYMEGAVTDDDGRFRLDLKADGQVLLVAHAQSRIPMEVELGSVNSHREIPDMVARRPSSDSRVRILHGDRLLPEHSVMIGDLSRGYVQPAVSATTDAQGELGTEWLVYGRRYKLSVYDVRETEASETESIMGLFWWAGQSSLDLKLLPQQLD
ncbi:MAG: hypothetical protein ACT4PV_14215 [Planctomycetaceae bacterium]